MNVKEFLAVAIGVLTLFSMVCAGLFWVIKYIGLPYLEKNLIKPVKEVNTQVSVNSFVSAEPTMLDRIHTISNKVHDVEEQVDGVETKVNTANNTLGILSGVWEHQMDFNTAEFKKIWQAIHNKHQQSYDEGSRDE